MKLVTIRHSRMLAGIANMLECLGHDTDDRTIALNMEAPYLFLQGKEGYIAGTALLRPEWINLYLHSIGFHLGQLTIPQKDVAASLRTRQTAMLAICPSKDSSATHPVVYTGLARGRFVLCSFHPPLPQIYSFTAPQLLSHLPDKCTVYTLDAVPPESTDYLPYLGSSLENLRSFWQEFQQIQTRCVTRSEYQALQKSHLGALLHHLLPLLELTNDQILINELKIAGYFYESVFTENRPERLLLRDHIPETFVKNCVHWLMEDISDRMYELGASDDLVDFYRYSQTTCHLINLCIGRLCAVLSLSSTVIHHFSSNDAIAL